MGLLGKFTMLRAETSPLDVFDAEVARLEAARAAADAEALRLESLRPDVLLTGSNDELRQHDDAAGRCRREVEQALARLDALTRERATRESLDSEQRDMAERQALYQNAIKARAEGKRLLGEYEKGAKALAATLERIAAASQAIGRANDCLPAGKAEVDHFEIFNGRAAVSDEPAPMIRKWFTADGHDLGTSIPMGVPGLVSRMVKGYGGATIPGTGRPAVAHVPLLSRVALPRSADLSDGFHWQGAETKPKPATADELAILRYHGLRT